MLVSIAKLLLIEQNYITIIEILIMLTHVLICVSYCLHANWSKYVNKVLNNKTTNNHDWLTHLYCDRYIKNGACKTDNSVKHPAK